MSVELLYTSAVQGLKQGSRGFCTVISTAGMPINLATRLEGLSAYRHIYPPNHPDAAKNPVNFNHLRINVGGRTISILSRVADYGIDYSQRTNKLAHHVVVEAHEQTPAGPAWLMQSTSILRSRWDGQCATPASGPTIPMQDQAGKICTTWKSLSGDAGWGGVVADTFASAVGKPLWIIYDLGQREQLLTLLNEAIALLPHEKRWSATFSTYATNVPPDADCKVRCVPAGSDDARLAPAMGKVIDLTKKQSVPAVTELVTAAREGIVFTPKPVPSAPRPIAVETPQVHSAVPQPDVNDFELVEDDFEMKLKPIGPPSVNSSHLPPSPPPTVRSRRTPQPNYAQLAPDTPDSNSWMKWALIGASVTIVCLMIAVGGLVYTNKVNEKLELARKAEQAEAEEKAAKLEEAKIEAKKREEEERKEREAKSKAEEARIANQKAEDAARVERERIATEKAAEEKRIEEEKRVAEEVRLKEEVEAAAKKEFEEAEKKRKEEMVMVARVDARELFKGKDKGARLKLTVELNSPFDPAVSNVYCLERSSGPLNLSNLRQVLGENDFAKSIRLEKVKPLVISLEVVGPEETTKIAAGIISEWEQIIRQLELWNRKNIDRQKRTLSPIAKESLSEFVQRISDWQSEFAQQLEAVSVFYDKTLAEHKDKGGKFPEIGLILEKIKDERDLLDSVSQGCANLQSSVRELCSEKKFSSGPVLYLKPKDAGDDIDSTTGEDGKKPFMFEYRIEFNALQSEKLQSQSQQPLPPAKGINRAVDGSVQ